MALHKQNTDLNSTWEINTSDDTWTLAQKATITTDNEYGISLGGDITGNSINIFGDIIAGGDFGTGMIIAGDYNDITVGKNAVIDATFAAIDIDGTGNTITNTGKIISGNGGTAIGADLGTEIVNTGTIKGGSAVFATLADLNIENSGKMIGSTFAIRAESDDAMIVNHEGGLIKGNTFGIILQDAEGATIKNFGTLSGDVAITAFGDSATKVINHGIINGDIDLAGGNDRFDSRGGNVNGKVDGGDGADMYLVDSQSTKITEQADHGADTVKSTVTYTLGANLENLSLGGSQDINGTGNAHSNVIYGNRGDNSLKGMGGEDYIVGGKGDDLMIGGKGDDVFDFKHGTGHDTIQDFRDGHDLLLSDFVTSQVDFDDLMANHLKVQGDDLMIKYGDDTLLLKNMEKSELDFGDFLNI